MTADEAFDRISAIGEHRFIGWLVDRAPEIVESVLEAIAEYDESERPR